jgi:amino-acid N-acetyltransferase
MSMPSVEHLAPWAPQAPGVLTGVTIRRAEQDDADAIHALIAAHARPGRLLPRTREEVTSHVQRFMVASYAETIVGCAELAPLGRDLAEVRSLVVSEEARGLGLGRSLVEAVAEAAADASFGRLCAFTHAPAFFVRLGFSLVPHLELPEKIAADCAACSLFRVCGQQAVLLTVVGARS